MFTLTIQSQMTFSAAMQYPFDEEVTGEFKDFLYDTYMEYGDVLPAKFYEAVQNKTLFDHQALMVEFEAWCKQQTEEISQASNVTYEQRGQIVAKFDESAQSLMLESFHDGEILKAAQQGDDFVLFMNMSGGFVSHSHIELVFHEARVEGQIEGYYLYDELIETDDGFALRVLSSYGSPYMQGTVYFKNMSARGVFRPAVYTEPQDVTTWSQFVQALNPADEYFTIVDTSFVPIELHSLAETAQGIYAGELFLGRNYEEARGRVFCATYEDPYAHFSEPIEDDALIEAIFSEDQTLKVRAFNTIFARGEAVAHIVADLLQRVEPSEENEMYFGAMAYRFHELGCLSDALFKKWK